MEQYPEQQLTDLITAIQALERELGTPAADPRTGLAVAKVSLSSAQELKTSVDRFRIFLWAYIDSWSNKASTASKLRDIRIACASDLLVALSRDFQQEGVPATPAVERLQTEIDRVSKLLARQLHH